MTEIICEAGRRIWILHLHKVWPHDLSAQQLILAACRNCRAPCHGRLDTEHWKDLVEEKQKEKAAN
jgi:hypothetical protein